MKSIEQFMKDFFRARTAEIKREAENRAPFRKAFFTDDCNWDNRKQEAARSEAEKILSVSGNDKEQKKSHDRPVLFRYCVII